MTATAAATAVDRGARSDVSARHGGAKALLFTVFGEFVLPAGGSVWTSTLVAAADVLGITEKNARQAIARIGDEGLIEPIRHGRRVRWSLTREGSDLLAEGAHRIYSFGASPIEWGGEWLVAYCPVETGRSDRHRLRSRLRFLGFGELAPRLLISPHLDREVELRRVLDDLGLSHESIVLHSRSGSDGDDAELVARAWDLDLLAAAYDGFVRARQGQRPDGDGEAFRATVELVHAWRRFPFTDPELPTELLPDPWVGGLAERVFRERHAEWSPGAQRWFDERETTTGRKPARS